MDDVESLLVKLFVKKPAVDVFDESFASVFTKVVVEPVVDCEEAHIVMGGFAQIPFMFVDVLFSAVKNGVANERRFHDPE